MEEMPMSRTTREILTAPPMQLVADTVGVMALVALLLGALYLPLLF